MRCEAELQALLLPGVPEGADQTGLMGAERAVVHAEKQQRVSLITPTSNSVNALAWLSPQAETLTTN